MPKKSGLILMLCSTIFLSNCSSSDDSEEVHETETSASETNPCAKRIKEITGAEECLISYSAHNSLAQPLKTIQIEIVNPKATYEAMPLWRFASVGALQYLSIMKREDFLSDQFIEIKRTHAWDETLIDSSVGHLTGFPTKYVVLADSFYNVTLPILGNVEARGFISARDEIDTLVPDFVLLAFDSTRLVDERNFGRPQTWSPGGFTQEISQNGDTLLSVHVLEKNAVLTGEHIFQFSTVTGKIIWWEAQEYVPGN